MENFDKERREIVMKRNRLYVRIVYKIGKS